MKTSNKIEWAKKELEYFKKYIPCDDEKWWEYYDGCYNSALKALESVVSDGHSGNSIILTRELLKMMLEGKPMTIIYDEVDIWNEVDANSSNSNVKLYQCNRMSSLFKHVNPNGCVWFSDSNRVTCYEVGTRTPYQSNIINRLIDARIKPIEMPYCPEKIDVILEWDEHPRFIEVLYMVVPDKNDIRGKKIIDISKYFAFPDKGKGLEWKEVTKEEYLKLIEEWREKA